MEDRVESEHQELAVLVAYTEDDYLRENGSLGGSAQAVATAIQQAGYSKEPRLTEDELELLRMALQNAVARSQEVARELRSRPGVSAAASGSLTRRYRLLLERFGGPSLPVAPVEAQMVQADEESSLKPLLATTLPSELPVQHAPVELNPRRGSDSAEWHAVPMAAVPEDEIAQDNSQLSGRKAEQDDPTKEYGVANFGDLDDVLSRPDGKRTTREWATNMLQREYGDILVARDWGPEPPLAS